VKNPVPGIPGLMHDRRAHRIQRGAFFLAAAALLLFSLLTPTAAARDVKVALYEVPPTLYTDENGNAAGIFADMVQDIAAQNNWNVTWIHGTLAQSWDRLAAGEIDLMAGVVETPEREKYNDFSREPALSAWSQVYAPGGSDISTVLDLDNKKVIVIRGDASGIAFRDFAKKFRINVTYVEKDTLSDAFTGTAAGEADAMVAFSMGGDGSAGTYGLSATPVMFNPTTLQFAVPQGKNADLLAATDRYIADGKNNPSSAYDRTMQKWFGMRGARLTIPPHLWYGLAIIAGLAALFVLLSVLLRREVRRKTAELTRRNKELQSAYERLTLNEEELRENYRNLHTVEQALMQARKKLNLLNRHTLEDIQNGIFTLRGYLQVAGDAGCNRDAEKYLEKGKGTLATIADNIRFAKKYQDLGIKEPRWQEVNYAIINALSHIDSARISRTVCLDNLEIYADPLLEDVFITILDTCLLQRDGIVAVSIHYRRNADSVTILIENNCPGIPAEEKEKIFAWEYDGRGDPGLFLAREILSITGITLKETGDPGAGARFEITVPEGHYRFGSNGTSPPGCTKHSPPS